MEVTFRALSSRVWVPSRDSADCSPGVALAIMRMISTVSRGWFNVN